MCWYKDSDMGMHSGIDMGLDMDIGLGVGRDMGLDKGSDTGMAVVTLEATSLTSNGNWRLPH